MRLEESCGCGAQFVAVFGGSSFDARGNDRETKEVRKQLAFFRRIHAGCVPPVSDDPKEKP